ncbi:hypothetical protein HK405_010542 [Cladochytrium tenue]|nr:hypothetical protein HK405_010542 [Cladochytrium tenue]
MTTLAISPDPPAEHDASDAAPRSIPARRPGASRVEEMFLIDRFFTLDLSMLPPFVHRGTFCSNLTAVDPMLRFAVCAGGALLSGQPVVDTSIAMWYFDQARSLADKGLEAPSLERLQAHIILTVLVETVYILITLQALLLKLDVDPDNLPLEMRAGMSWVEMETRRRCWWVLYMGERAHTIQVKHTPFISKNLNAVKPLCRDDIWFSCAPTDSLAQEAKNSRVSDNIQSLLAIIMETLCSIMLVSQRSATDKQTESEILSAELALDKELLYFAGEIPARFAFPSSKIELLEAFSTPRSDWSRRFGLFFTVRASIAILTRRRALCYLLAVAIRKLKASHSHLADPFSVLSPDIAAHAAAVDVEAYLAPAYTSAFHRTIASSAEAAETIAVLAAVPFDPFNIARGSFYHVLETALVMVMFEKSASAFGPLVDTPTNRESTPPTIAAIATGAVPALSQAQAWLGILSSFLHDVGAIRYVSGSMAALLDSAGALEKDTFLVEILKPRPSTAASLHDTNRIAAAHGGGALPLPHPVPAWSRRIQAFAERLKDYFHKLHLIQAILECCVVGQDSAALGGSSSATTVPDLLTPPTSLASLSMTALSSSSSSAAGSAVFSDLSPSDPAVANASAAGVDPAAASSAEDAAHTAKLVAEWLELHPD